MTGWADPAVARALRTGQDQRTTAVIRARELRYKWAVVSEVSDSLRCAVRMGSATGPESRGVMWGGLRPNKGDVVLVELPPPGGTRRVVHIAREFAVGASGLQVVSVTAYGAVGTGLADDSLAFGKAFATGASMVYVPNGTYRIDQQVSMPSNTELVGESRDGVLIVRGNTAAPALIDTGWNSRVSNMTFDGAWDALGNHLRVELAVRTGSVAERILVRNCSYIGVTLSGTAPALRDSVLNGNAVGNSAIETGDGYFGVWSGVGLATAAEVTRCVIRDWHGNGAFMGGANSRVADSSFFANHRMSDPTPGGQIDVKGIGCTVSNCFFDGTGGGVATMGVEVEGLDVLVIGNTIQNQGAEGIICHTGGRVIGNVVKNSGKAGAQGAVSVNTYAGIRTKANISGWAAIGNRCFDDQGTKTQTYGLYIDVGTADSYLVTGNDLNGNLTGPILNGGTGTARIIATNLPASINDPAGSGAVFMSGSISPAQLVANTNDWAPTGFATCSVIRLSTNASRNLSGLAGGADGRVVLIFNTGSFAIVLTNQDAASTAANRFAIGSSRTLNGGDGMALIYDGAASRWRAWAKL